MVYAISHINTLYNQLNLGTEVLDASFIIGNDLENLTQFVFNRTPTFGVYVPQLEDLGYIDEPILRSDLDNSYSQFIGIINQFILENYGETPVTSINFYPFSKEQKLNGVQKKVSLNYIFKKNIKDTILEKFNQHIAYTDSKSLAKMTLLLYKTHKELPVSDNLGITSIREFRYHNEFVETTEQTPLTVQQRQVDSNTQQISVDPLE